MSKVTPEERQAMQDDYIALRNQKYTKSIARKLLSDKYDRGLTTIWDNTYMCDNPPEEVEYSKPEIGYPKTYILTSWELRVKPDYKFIACLEQMAEAYDAELILVPLNKGDVRYLPEKVREKFHVVTENIDFNENLQLKYIETNALIQSPLSGHSGAYPNKTSIIPGLVKELRCEPSQYYVKQLLSTGSLGYLDASVNDYVDQKDDAELGRKWRNVTTRIHGKPTAIAQNYVVPAALVIDVIDDKTFLSRFVSSHRSGVVYDLNLRFTPTGYEESQPASLVVGDTHAALVDDDALLATKEMILKMNPKEVVLQDFFDGESLNHHEISDAVKFNDVMSIEEEATVTEELLDEFCEISNKIVYLQSNHDDFAEKFLSGPNHLWRLNRNYEIACELQLYRVQTGLHPIIRLLNLDGKKNVKFVSDKDNHYVGKVLVKHGHEGVGGARAGFTTMAKIYNYYVQGHLHSPAVYRNAAMAGLTAQLDHGYNKGASAWLHANVVIQPDSSCQLLCIIRGVWRA